MAVPQNRVTRSKRGMRRAHDALVGSHPNECPSCGERGTLQVQRTTLRPATRHSEGQERGYRTCSNCGFRDENLRRIPIQRSSSGSSGFGGGSSSGGGASGRF